HNRVRTFERKGRMRKKCPGYEAREGEAWRRIYIYDGRPNRALQRSSPGILDIFCRCDRVPPMSVRMRHTSSHTRNRRSHHALKNQKVVKDKESGALRLPHRLDETTGMYRGKLVMKPKAKKVTAEAVAE